jgi:hypothetical protein
VGTPTGTCTFTVGASPANQVVNFRYPVSFSAHVVPIFAQARRDCVGCHDQFHRSGFDATGQSGTIYDNVVNEPARNGFGTTEPFRINKTGNVHQSLILRYPLGMPPIAHPGQVWQGMADADYMTIVHWINGGFPNN